MDDVSILYKRHYKTSPVIIKGACHPKVPLWNNNRVLAGLVDTSPCEQRVDFVSHTLARGAQVQILSGWSPRVVASQPWFLFRIIGLGVGRSGRSPS